MSKYVEYINFFFNISGIMAWVLFVSWLLIDMDEIDKMILIIGIAWSPGLIAMIWLFRWWWKAIQRGDG